MLNVCIYKNPNGATLSSSRHSLRRLQYSTGSRTRARFWRFSLNPSRSGHRKGKSPAGKTETTTKTSKASWMQRTGRRKIQVRQSWPPPRRWPPQQTSTNTSWLSFRPSQSSLHKSLRIYSLIARTSARASGSVVGQTSTSPRRPIWLPTWVSRASWPS